MSSEDTAGRSGRRSFLARFGPSLERNRFLFQTVLDVTAWVVALPAAMVLRFELEVRPDHWGSFTVPALLLTAGLAAAMQVGFGSASGLYRGRWRVGSFDEIAHLVASVAVTAVVLAVVNRFVLGFAVPTSVTLIGGLLALALMVGARYTWRLLLERRLRPSGEHLARVLVFGAGEGGVRVVTSMLRTPDSPYLPVAMLDDDPIKANLRVNNVPVVGGRDDIGDAAARFRARTLVIAVPSADPELLRHLSDIAVRAGLDVRLLPPLHEFIDGKVGVSDIRPVTEADLLGRHEVDTDLESISGYLTGRRVLVTGAGGSIGAELCYQISRLAPDRLVMLDRDESALHAVQLRIEGRAMLDTRDLVVCDLRDRDALAEVFAEHEPEVVFHAGALKHLPLLELYPAEALKSNVYGTRNVLELACDAGVDRFVNISTDKAADPISVLGFSKRIAERLTADVASRSAGTYLSVRFGNVLGSRGSVLTAFEQQVRSGGPLTVTDPDTTRYFMTVEEAVQLVIQAGAVGRDGEALVLDMGEPVRIDDVARRLASQSDRPIEITYTGLRPGEKLHEVLFGAGEVDRRPAHPLISHVAVPPLDIGEVDEAVATVGPERADLVALLADLASKATPEPVEPRRD